MRSITDHWMFPVVVMLTALLAGCNPPPTLRVVQYCHLPQHECQPFAEQAPDVQAQLLEQAWCCPNGEPCYPVDALSECLITDVAIYCEYGRSSPQSGGGASGFECFG